MLVLKHLHTVVQLVALPYDVLKLRFANYFHQVGRLTLLFLLVLLIKTFEQQLHVPLEVVLVMDLLILLDRKYTKGKQGCASNEP